ncbi:MAG: hypothetical protein HY722_08870 [Planctomycetes bacterium]|nr:hypothetical protein [Planctomycetota bacterium]
MELHLDPVLPAWALAAFLATFAAGVAVAARELAIEGGRRAALHLLALEALALVLASVPLLRPRLDLEVVTQVPPRVLALVDASGSMGEAAPGPAPSQTRLERARALVEALGRSTGAAELEALAFSEGPLLGLAEARAAGGTDLEAALRAALERRGEAAALVLLSDGRANRGADPTAAALEAARLGVPVHCVAFGTDERAPGGGLRGLRLVVAREVLVDNRVPVHAQFRATGLAGRELVARLAVDGQAAGETVVRPAGEDAILTVRMDVVLAQEGEHELELSLGDGATGEAGPAVLQGRVLAAARRARVAIVEGTLRWEYKFLRRAVEEAPELGSRSYRLFLKDGSTPVPSVDELARYHVVVLGELPRETIPEGWLEALAERVARGTGLLLLGGAGSLGPGGYADTPLAALSPLVLSPLDERLDGEWQAEPTPAGERFFSEAFGLPVESVAATWRRLPPLDGRVTVSGVKPGAEVLLAGPAGDPVVAAHRYGRGRVVAVTADTTWRWRFAPRTEGELHLRYWHALLRWLADRERLATGSVVVRVDQARMRGADPLDAWVAAVGPEGAPLEGAGVRLVLEGPGGLRVETEAAPAGREHHARVLPPEGGFPPGRYLLRARVGVVEAGTEVEVGTDELGFEVLDPDDETADPTPRHDTLRAIARASGGVYTHEGRPGPVFGALAALAAAPGGRARRIEPVDLWDHPAVLVAFLALAGAAWALRRSYGMP